MPDYSVKQIDEVEAAFGGAFKRIRASLGATAFGLQVVDLPPNSGDIFPEHDHLHDGQEEVYTLLSGSGEMEVDGERFPIDTETFVRVAASCRRRIRSGPSGARILAVGGMPGQPYTIQANSELGGPETLFDTASSSMASR